VNSTNCVALTALARVNTIVVPEIDIPVITLLAPATETAKDVASTPVPSMDSSKLRVSCVGDEVLTLPPVKPGA
jgi:hypothetical protein